MVFMGTLRLLRFLETVVLFSVVLVNHSLELSHLLDKA